MIASSCRALSKVTLFSKQISVIAWLVRSWHLNPKSRIDRLPRVISVLIAPSYALRIFQGTLSRANLVSATTMNVAKGDSNQTGPKRRQKAFKQVRKPISTEAVSTEEKLEVDNSVCLPSSSTAKSSKNDIITKANVKDGKCSITMEVDTPLVPFVKGKGGSVQKQIEEELQVKLIFSLSKEETSLAVIEGNKVENLTKASERIKQVLKEAVQSRMLDYSHFISLPLAENSDLVQKLLQFQSTILGEIAEGDSGLGIDKSIFIKPKTFHLTVLMLKLWNKDRVATASDILQRISSKVMDALENRPISIQLKGMVSFPFCNPNFNENSSG